MGLTENQKRVFQMYADGLPYTEIAAALKKSKNNIHSTMWYVVGKYNFANPTHAAVELVRKGVID